MQFDIYITVKRTIGPVEMMIGRPDEKIIIRVVIHV
jgi:hypothetical protein